MSATGFNAYHRYLVVKHVFFSSKLDFDVYTSLPNKQRYLDKWNREMIHKKDSLFFLKLEKLYKPEQLTRMFCYYCIENPNFYVTDIMDDEFKLFNKMESELKILQDVLEGDFYTLIVLSMKNKLSIKKMFYRKNGIPVIFQMYDKGIISMHSLIAFDIVWGIFDRINITSLNVVEEKKIEKYKKVLVKYSKMVYSAFNFDIEEFLKVKLTSIKNGG